MSTQFTTPLVPTILCLAQSMHESFQHTRISGLTSEDPLPAVVNVSLDGYIISNSTKLTAINRETTDDV